MTELDFLNAHEQSFPSERDFFEYIDSEDVVRNTSKDINIIGTVNNYRSRQGFLHSLDSSFEKIWSQEDLYLLAAHSDGRAIPYYVYYDDDFPIFLTTASITKEMPDTIEKFLHSDPDLGRFWLSMEQLDRLRRILTRKYNDLIIPFFTGHRSEYSDIPAEKRGDIERTITYWAEDGRETYKEMRTKYGILPTNLRFERPGDFKFGVKQEGIFTHQKGSIIDTWELFEEEKENKQILKDTINTGGYDSSSSQVFSNHEISSSSPWGIKMSSEIQEGPLDNFRSRLGETKWEFGVSEYRKKGASSFSAEIVDDVKYDRTLLNGHHDRVRVYPLDGNDIDPQFRVFNFIQDHFDSKCTPVEV